MNFKDTLNLPKTDFPMKASLANREPLQLEDWNKNNIYKTVQESRKEAPLFFLHDGPPYANGHIHMGHALNKILKDFVIKYKTLQGFNVPYTPGWDCHGLPIEHQLLKKRKAPQNEQEQVEFREAAKEFALKWMTTQRDEFKRLGIFADWEKPYLTLNTEYEASILEALRDINNNGFMYKARKPVYWSIGCETALAEAEVEYQDHTSPSVYVAFPLQDDDRSLVIWTTTPWTLPANMAVAVHEDFIYCDVETEKGTFIVAKDLLSSFAEKNGFDTYTIKAEYKGTELEGLKYSHPFLDRISPVILSEFVTLETGTGLVHTAPGHGQEDYIVGLRYNLEVFSPVDEKGRLTEKAGVFPGTPVFKANPLIIDLLKEKNALLSHSDITHSYPHCWRSKKPIIFRATEQWFISMSHDDIRNKSIQTVQETSWIPESGEARITSMVENRPDWCISRQRLWGVPIPELICKKCSHSFLDNTFINKLIDQVKEKGVDIWFEKSLQELVPESVICPECQSSDFAKGQNIVDVWFESGVSLTAILKTNQTLTYPADLYLEGSDQHRGWFQSSLLASTTRKMKAPYKTVLTHGFVVDGKGLKMSKSMGNVVDPLSVINKYGADILRLWVASCDYSVDLKLSESHFAQITDSYRKVRNTFRFMIGNLCDFSYPDHKTSSVDDLMDIDKWVMGEFRSMINEVAKDMDQYRFYRAWSRIYQFCNTELSSIYFNIQRDILYCFAADDPVRRSCQTTMHVILHALVKVCFPFLSYTAEEVFKNISPDKNTTIAIEKWPSLPEINNFSSLKEKFTSLFAIRSESFKMIEELIAKKIIKTSLQTEIKVTLKNAQLAEEINQNTEEFRRFMIAAKVIVTHNDSMDTEYSVEVSQYEGKKCERCWVTFNENTNEESHGQEICPFCKEVVKNMSNISNG